MLGIPGLITPSPCLQVIQSLIREVCTSFPRLWLTKYHKQGDFDNRNFLPRSSAGWNTEIVVPVGLVLPESWEHFPGGTSGKEPPHHHHQCRRPKSSGSVPASGRSPGGGHSKSLQYCLENPMDRGAWQATDHGVAKSLIQLKGLSTHS